MATRTTLGHECGILENVATLVDHRDQLEGSIAGAVAHARDDGFSWQAIADALGVTKQAAMKRYRGGVE